MVEAKSIPQDEAKPFGNAQCDLPPTALLLQPVVSHFHELAYLPLGVMRSHRKYYDTYFPLYGQGIVTIR